MVKLAHEIINCAQSRRQVHGTHLTCSLFIPLRMHQSLFRVIVGLFDASKRHDQRRNTNAALTRLDSSSTSKC